MTKTEKISLIRESIQKNNYPLEYQSIDYWDSSNCYSYAIGSTYFEDRYEENYIYNLGYISNHYPAKNMKEAEYAFLADMEVLGIQVRKSDFNEPVHGQEWKVAFFYEDCFIDSYDFHFARQNADMSWSHQEGIWRPIRPLGDSPEYCTDLDFVGYYILKVKKQYL